MSVKVFIINRILCVISSIKYIAKINYTLSTSSCFIWNNKFTFLMHFILFRFFAFSLFLSLLVGFRTCFNSILIMINVNKLTLVKCFDNINGDVMITMLAIFEKHVYCSHSLSSTFSYSVMSKPLVKFHMGIDE